MFADIWTDYANVENAPEPCRALAEATGAREAAKLCAQFGGHSYNVPDAKALGEGMPPEALSASTRKVVRVIGPDALKKLCLALGGTRVRIPSARQWYAAVRKQRICEDYSNGLTVREIAWKYGVRCDTVLDIVGAVPVARLQS